MKKFLAFLPIILTLAASGQTAPREAGEPGITRQQADAILNELRQIRQMLEKALTRAQGPDGGGKAALTFNAGAPVLGNKDAPLTMVEFTDYQCSFCQRFHLVTFPEIRKKYIDTGKVRFVSRDFPLDFHSNAFRAAEAARCAGDQGQFWPMRDTLVANAGKLSPEAISGYAGDLKLDAAAFKACLDSGRHKDAIQKEMAEASSLGVEGTPSFVIGRSTVNGVEGTLVVGALPLAAFDAKFNELEAK
jgi:protein-disulfide isomerase